MQAAPRSAAPAGRDSSICSACNHPAEKKKHFQRGIITQHGDKPFYIGEAPLHHEEIPRHLPCFYIAPSGATNYILIMKGSISMNYFFENNDRQYITCEEARQEASEIMLMIEHSRDKERRRRSRERKLSESRLQWLERGA